MNIKMKVEGVCVFRKFCIYLSETKEGKNVVVKMNKKVGADLIVKLSDKSAEGVSVEETFSKLLNSPTSIKEVTDYLDSLKIVYKIIEL